MNRSFSRSIFTVILVICTSFSLHSTVAAADSGRETGNDSTLEDGGGSSHVLNVKDFSAKGDGKTDDTAAFASALKILAEQGGTLVVPSGSYLVGNLKIGSHTRIKGMGVPRPVLMKTPGARTILDMTGEVVSGVRHGVRDVTIESLTVRGRSVLDGFSEFVHNVNVMGVTRLLISNVVFEAFQGDGLYLGSRFSSTQPVAHNSEVVVVNSEFRGVNSQNRNGISVIDCNHCIIERNSFSDLSRPEMPGPIDIEPDELDDSVQNIIVRNNTIKGTNGLRGIAVSLRQGVFQQPPGPITIEGNYIEGAKTGILIWGSYTAGPLPPPIDVRIRGNTVHGTNTPLFINVASKVKVSDNDFSDSTSFVQVGCQFAFGISFTKNRFVRLGTQAGSGVQLCGTLSGVVFTRNTFTDVGSTAANASAISVLPGTMESINFRSNTFSSPNDITKTAIRWTTANPADGGIVWTGNVLNDAIQKGTLP